MVVFILVVAATFASYAVAWVVGVPLLVPALNTLAAFPFLVHAVGRGRFGRALGLMLTWAAAMACASTTLSYLDPIRTAHLFVHADVYRHEMFIWVQTGMGAESDPVRFAPTHALHAAVFCLLSWVSGSLLSMPMGALLTNDMGHFVGALASVSQRPVLTVLAGWLPWSLVRIASFVTLGVALAGPVLSRVMGFRYELRQHRPALVVALAGLATDLVLKAALAPPWRVLLKHLVGW